MASGKPAGAWQLHTHRQRHGISALQVWGKRRQSDAPVNDVGLTPVCCSSTDPSCLASACSRVENERSAKSSTSRVLPATSSSGCKGGQRGNRYLTRGTKSRGGASHTHARKHTLSQAIVCKTCAGTPPSSGPLGQHHTQSTTALLRCCLHAQPVPHAPVWSCNATRDIDSTCKKRESSSSAGACRSCSRRCRSSSWSLISHTDSTAALDIGGDVL